jgi:hypothetical protein
LWLLLLLLLLGFLGLFSCVSGDNGGSNNPNNARLVDASIDDCGGAGDDDDGGNGSWTLSSFVMTMISFQVECCVRQVGWLVDLVD